MAEMRIIDSNAGCEKPKSNNSSTCNICRNHKNIHDPSHRKSKVHQKKLNERFCVIRAKMKDIKPTNIIVHDELWKSEDKVFCYFCGKSIQRHAVHDGIAVENLGYLNHYSCSSHQTEVINYLKYHGRNENYKVFCKSQSFLQSFLNNIPEAKKKYLEKLDALDKKDIQNIKDLETERKKIVEENFQDEHVCDATTNIPTKAICNTDHKSLPMDTKIPPWLSSSSETIETSKPVIGPTLETLQSHIKKKKKKSLPPKRLQTHLDKKKSKVNKRWLPPFSGVWNKGRSRQLKQALKK